MKSFLKKVMDILRRAWDYRLAICVLIVIICACISYRAVRGYFQQADKEKSALELSIQRVTALQTTNGQLTQEVEQVRHITSDQLKHASDSIFKLTSKNAKLVKDVNRLAIIAEQVHLSDTVFAPFPDSAKISPDITCDSLRALMPDLVHTPLNWEYQSDSLSITGIIQKDGVSILSLDLPDTLNERDIVKKVGFLHWGRKYSTEFHHSNSLISINGASVYTVDKTPSWWYRTGKPALAVIISAALTSFILIHAK